MPLMRAYDQFKHWKRNSTGNAELIISSHGGRSLLGGRNLLNGFGKRKVPAGMSLVFYGPDRSVLTSGTVKFEFIDHNLAGQPHKVKAAGDSYVDYELTKLQGYHGNEDETYDVVESCLSSYDVLTVRHRGVTGGSVMLSEVLGTLVKDGYVYSKVHCLFCRCFDSVMLSAIKGRSTHVTPT